MGRIEVIAPPAPPAGDAYRDAPADPPLVLSVRWFRAIAIFGVVVGLALGGCFGSGYDMFGLVPGWFRWPVVVVAVVFVYASVCRLVNRSTIRVDNESITVSHGPLPWGSKKNLAVRDIAGLYCKTFIQRSNRTETRTYEVHAKLNDGTTAEIIDSLPLPDEASFIKKQIDERLAKLRG
jgi:hypothetical protein